MSEWKPIDTAPKEGQSFLVWTPDNNCMYHVSRRLYEGDTFFIWASYGATLQNSQCVTPTHWMPLPTPPIQGDKP